jgi:hypothetical protein
VRTGTGDGGLGRGTGLRQPEGGEGKGGEENRENDCGHEDRALRAAAGVETGIHAISASEGANARGGGLEEDRADQEDRDEREREGDRGGHTARETLPRGVIWGKGGLFLRLPRRKVAHLPCPLQAEGWWALVPES